MKMNIIIYTSWERTAFSLKVLCLIVISSLFVFSHTTAKTINFDATYGNSGDVASKLQQAINNAAWGDVIQFNSSYYNLGAQNITVSKAITFSGKTPSGFNKWWHGATGIQTTLGNTGTFTLRANNIKFANLSLVKKNLGETTYDILIDARHTTYLNSSPVSVSQQQYTGLDFNNVVLSTGAYLIHAGNGAQINMTNVSFLEFRRIGFWTDRKGRIDNMKRASFDRCYFKPEANIQFDDRAISLDAGNTEYPVIWNMDNTTVYNSTIVDSGIAFSRCHNATIELCIFDDSKGLVDLVHIEEFSYDMRVKGNTFKCNQANSKIFLIDRELQVSSYITIENNTITGQYNFFISAYAPSHLTVKNNNFSNANSINDHSINLTYYETRASEPIPFELVSNHITITGNTGLENWKNKSLRVNFPNSGAVYNITNYTAGQKNLNFIASPPALIGNATYEIVNKSTGKKLAPSGGALTTQTGTSNNNRWRSYWSPPYTYHFQNVGTGKWLETHVGYTEFDIFNNQPENIYPFTNSYGAGAKLPFWCVVNVNGYFEIFPGGNEKQSALATEGNNVKLVFAKVGNPDGTRSVKNLGDNAKWSFNYVGGLRQDNFSSQKSGEGVETQFMAYPNPAKGILNVFFQELGQEKVTVQLYDIYGSEVLSTELLADIHHAINISELTKGVYILKTSTGHQERIMVK